jgi:DNA-binding response OmpR family regulator
MKHILLLEADRGFSSVLARCLEEEKYYVSTTARVVDALKTLERVKLDLFIAEALLADGSAYATVDFAKLHKVPYFLMTGSPTHLAELEANGQFHLAKPFKLVNFMNAVRERIGAGDDNGRN